MLESNTLKKEQGSRDCFLCNPDTKLIYCRDMQYFALCGYGPILEGYSVISPKQHIYSCADVYKKGMVDFFNFAEHIRTFLTKNYGTCLLTEHGRLPVCFDKIKSHEPHCFHAHFLLFPSAPNIETLAASYFEKSKINKKIEDAMKYAYSLDEYFLFSPKPNKFVIFYRPKEVVRQFARFIVAKAIGKPELASWVDNPNIESSLKTAQKLNNLCRKGKI